MAQKQNSETRYYLDLDLRTRKILGWGFDQRDRLVNQELSESHYHRVFLTRGQYNKLTAKNQEVQRGG